MIVLNQLQVTVVWHLEDFHNQLKGAFTGCWLGHCLLTSVNTDPVARTICCALELHALRNVRCEHASLYTAFHNKRSRNQRLYIAFI